MAQVRTLFACRGVLSRPKQHSGTLCATRLEFIVAHDTVVVAAARQGSVCRKGYD